MVAYHHDGKPVGVLTEPQLPDEGDAVILDLSEENRHPVITQTPNLGFEWALYL